MHVLINMGFRTNISIDLKEYEDLSKLKQEKESFTGVIRRLIESDKKPRVNMTGDAQWIWTKMNDTVDKLRLRRSTDVKKLMEEVEKLCQQQ